MTERKQSRVFGEVAQEYDAVRVGYPAELVDAVVAFYGGTPPRAVEVGAGTGLATRAFAALRTPITCVEPDAAMATVLAQRFAGDELVDIVVGTFETWTAPPTGVDLIYCAQAWHWIDPQIRFTLAHDALASGGVLALFGHNYGFADAGVDEALTDIYRRIAPSLVRTETLGGATAEVYPELTDPALWAEPTDMVFSQVVPTSTADYLRLLTTFSPHRMLPQEQRSALLNGIGELIDGDGGLIRQKVDTVLSLARKAPPE